MVYFQLNGFALKFGSAAGEETELEKHKRLLSEQHKLLLSQQHFLHDQVAHVAKYLDRVETQHARTSLLVLGFYAVLVLYVAREFWFPWIVRFLRLIRELLELLFEQLVSHLTPLAQHLQPLAQYFAPLGVIFMPVRILSGLLRDLSERLEFRRWKPRQPTRSDTTSDAPFRPVTVSGHWAAKIHYRDRMLYNYFTTEVRIGTDIYTARIDPRVEHSVVDMRQIWKANRGAVTIQTNGDDSEVRDSGVIVEVGELECEMRLLPIDKDFDKLRIHWETRKFRVQIVPKGNPALEYPIIFGRDILDESDIPWHLFCYPTVINDREDDPRLIDLPLGKHRTIPLEGTTASADGKMDIRACMALRDRRGVWVSPDWRPYKLPLRSRYV